MKGKLHDGRVVIAVDGGADTTAELALVLCWIAVEPSLQKSPGGSEFGPRGAVQIREHGL
jgi:hypothetical protein